MSNRPQMTIPAHLEPYSRTIRLQLGFDLHYYDAGSPAAPVLVLIHGLGDEADTWRHVIPLLAETHRVLALDLPGFGRSAHPWRAYSLLFFARSVGAFLEQLGISKATLVGSSLGAAVAQGFALSRPAQVEQLVLIGGGLPIEPGLPPAQLWWFLAPGLGEAAYTSLRRSQEEAYATLRPYYADLDALPPEDQAFLRARVWARVWSAGQRRAFLSALRWLSSDRALRAAEFRGRLATLATPTLLLWGEHDHIVPQESGAALAALLPNGRFTVLRGVGHLPQQEQPAALVVALHAGLAQPALEHSNLK
jgi:pimeloyl-ACP methyl ester carboxylesterase